MYMYCIIHVHVLHTTCTCIAFYMYMYCIIHVHVLHNTCRMHYSIYMCFYVCTAHSTNLELRGYFMYMHGDWHCSTVEECQQFDLLNCLSACISQNIGWRSNEVIQITLLQARYASTWRGMVALPRWAERACYT